MRNHGVSYHLYADDTQIYFTLIKFSNRHDMEYACAKIEARVGDIERWMTFNNLKLNSDKTELLVFHSKYRPAPLLDVLQVASAEIKPSADFAKNIGVVFDPTLNLDRHQVKHTCKSAFYPIGNLF
jgi:hypothetical protein